MQLPYGMVNPLVMCHYERTNMIYQTTFSTEMGKYKTLSKPTEKINHINWAYFIIPLRICVMLLPHPVFSVVSDYRVTPISKSSPSKENNGRISTTLIFGSALLYSYGLHENMCESKRIGRKDNLNPSNFHHIYDYGSKAGIAKDVEETGLKKKRINAKQTSTSVKFFQQRNITEYECAFPNEDQE
ncbi:hypothetical protein llap_4400 [Limosa lapponica baueri]|uniref:Uncharacterized protein n=1 Tax=Limosa lapponica baueri TaxID=1758121 RepID=A0A2I0UGX7_LIMLA|nr:hypothetical protein llap_4400 [Limosa lapponica baueri]